MALSDRERDVLAQMESHFAEEDPNFTNTMSSGADDEPGSSSSSQMSWDPRTVVISILLALAGIVIFFAGVHFQNILIGLAGFAVIVFSIYWAATRGTRSTRQVQQTSHDPKLQAEKARKAEQKRQRRARPWLDG